MGSKEAIIHAAGDIRFMVDKGFHKKVMAGFKSQIDSDPGLLFDGEKLTQFSLRTRYKIVAELDKYRNEIFKQRTQRSLNDMVQAMNDFLGEVEGK